MSFCNVEKATSLTAIGSMWMISVCLNPRVKRLSLTRQFKSVSMASSR